MVFGASVYGAGSTVTVQLAVFPPSNVVTETVAVPGANAVTMPL